MSHSPAASNWNAAASAWAETAIPWLMSASMHCVLLIILGLFAAQGAFWNDGSGADSGLRHTSLPRRRAAIIYDDDGGALDDSSGSLEARPPDLRQPTDQNQPAAGNPKATGPAGTNWSGEGAAGVGGPLASVLGTKPPIDSGECAPFGQPGARRRGTGRGRRRHRKNGHQGLARVEEPVLGVTPRTGVFGVQGQGYKFVYVFDRSGSMGGHGGAPLAAAQAQLIESLQDLGQTHQFQIIFYNERPHIFNPTGGPRPVGFGTDENKYQAEQFIESITADGATEHEDALALALRMAPDVIFFLTDADEPRLNPDQLGAHRTDEQGDDRSTPSSSASGRRRRRKTSWCDWLARTAASTSMSTSPDCLALERQAKKTGE